jgi:8-oxo-dGTP diphosphatase
MGGMDRHLIRTSANVLLVRNGKVLLSRRQNKGWGDGLLCIPGGHVEKGESPTMAALRELQEECGLNLAANRLNFFCVAQRKSKDHEYVAYEFTVSLNDSEEPVNTEPNECSELLWADPRNLPADIIDDFRSIIEQGYLNKHPFLELGYN